MCKEYNDTSTYIITAVKYGAADDSKSLTALICVRSTMIPVLT